MGGVKAWIRRLEDAWFDASRGVRTAGDLRRPEARGEVVGERRDSYVYAPVRVANGRKALRALRVKRLREYTFVDLGSGKGRMLFLAAELPFRRVIGVEFDAALHAGALENIARGRLGRRRRSEIQAVHANAAEYEFPAGPLVIYMFNPFGPEVLGRVLDNLERSLATEPRHIMVLMLWPQHAEMVARRAWLRESLRTRRYVLFETRGN